MPPITSDALVLRTYKLGETSKVVVLLTRERGKLRAVAKGARGPRSRYQSALEPLSEVRASLHGRQGAELYRLGQCDLLRSAFRAGGQGLEAALSLSYFAELLDAFAQEGEAEDAVYRLAVAVIAAAETGADVKALARYLEAWLLKLHGIYPPVDRCAGMRRRPPRRRSRVPRGRPRVRVRGCSPASGPVLTDPVRGFLAALFRRPPGEIPEMPAEASVLEGFHRDLISRHLERDLRSHRVLRDAAAGARG
jgi:DNA repair protein RecO (recombination protein O)